MSSTYLTVGEVARYLKLPEETVYKYARSGRIPASKVGKYWRFDQASVDEWVARCSNQGPEPVRAFIVDDEEPIRRLLSSWLTTAGHAAQVFESGVELLHALEAASCDLVFLDLVIPPPGGVETLRRIKAMRPDLPVVIITAHFDSHLMEQALELGPMTVLKKPIERAQFLGLVSGWAAAKR